MLQIMLQNESMQNAGMILGQALIGKENIL